MIRRIDVLGRSAFGVLCIAGMFALSVPVLVAVGAIAGIVIASDGEGGKGLAVWLLAWAAAASAGLLFFGISFVAWPLASDWITQWQGYATGLAIGAAGLGLMALLVFVSTWPLYLAVIVPLGATFAVGFSTPGWFLGIRRRPEATAGGKR